MMASTSLYLKMFFLVIASNSRLTKSTNDGFSVCLIHRNSKLSPFYNHSLTTFDRISSAVRRSVSRLNYIHYSLTSESLNSYVSSTLVPEDGEYLMIFSIGTPPTQLYAIADTASELSWVKCWPCKHCDTGTTRIFKTYKSSTYEKLSCDSLYCFGLGKKKTFCKDDKSCYYLQKYYDGLTTTGTLSSDKFSFEDAYGNAIDVGHIKFGCSDDASGPITGNESGILGLNRRALSLVSQLGYTKFAYCLVIPDSDPRPPGRANRMYFGSEAVIAGGQTPLVEEADDNYYYLTLQGISVGDEMVQIPSGIFDTNEDGEGGFIIDSGTTYTTLTQEAFDALVEALTKAINLPVKRNYRKGLDLCFEGSFDDLALQPDVTFHFSGTDVILMKETTYEEVESGVWCLAIVKSDKLLSIFGNFQQRNYYIGFDLEEEIVSFAPVDDCANF